MFGGTMKSTLLQIMAWHRTGSRPLPNTGPCITKVFATRRKNFSQWYRSFQRKLLSHWLKFLRHVAITLVIQGPELLHHMSFLGHNELTCCICLPMLDKTSDVLTSNHFVCGSCLWKPPERFLSAVYELKSAQIKIYIAVIVACVHCALHPMKYAQGFVMLIASVLNSLAPGRLEWNLKQEVIMPVLVVAGCASWNCPQMNVTGPYWC